MFHRYRCSASHQWITFKSAQAPMILRHNELAGMALAKTIDDLEDPGPKKPFVPNFSAVDKVFAPTPFGNLPAAAQGWINAMENKTALPITVENNGTHNTDPLTRQGRSYGITVTEFYVAIGQGSPAAGSRGVLRRAGNRVGYFFSQGHLGNTCQYSRVVMLEKAIPPCNDMLTYKRSALQSGLL